MGKKSYLLIISRGFTGFFDRSEYYDSSNSEIDVRMFFEFLYILVVINLLYSIITGIIIDTFGVLREEAESKQRDI